MDINAKATFMLAQIVGRIMIRQGGGKIVNMGSQAGFVAIDKHVAYMASKAAVIGITKVLALEWAKHNINVNAVSPTVVLTELGAKAWAGRSGRKHEEVHTGQPVLLSGRNRRGHFVSRQRRRQHDHRRKTWWWTAVSRSSEGVPFPDPVKRNDIERTRG